MYFLSFTHIYHFQFFLLSELHFNIKQFPIHNQQRTHFINKTKTNSFGERFSLSRKKIPPEWNRILYPCLQGMNVKLSLLHTLSTVLMIEKLDKQQVSLNLYKKDNYMLLPLTLKLDSWKVGQLSWKLCKWARKVPLGTRYSCSCLQGNLKFK